MQDDLVKRLRGPVREHAQRLVNRAFNNVDQPMPQLSIPADPQRDSDLIVCKGIEEAADRITALEAGLRMIACFDDVGANAHLERTGSYSRFDEPGSVQIARALLKERKG